MTGIIISGAGVLGLGLGLGLGIHWAAFLSICMLLAR
jgi:hypothetical protein